MLCKKCGATLPNGFNSEYCLVCRERTDALKNWIDVIMEEKQKKLEV